MKKTTKHQLKVAPQRNQPLIPVVRTPRNPAKTAETKTAELHLAVAIACHSAILSVDHIGDIVKKHGSGSHWGSLQLHRTKCSGLIKNLLSPCISAEIMEDFQDAKYALIIDESTDCSSQKHLCILIRYFSRKSNKIVTRFLCLSPVLEATGEKIFLAIEEAITACGQSLRNCIGLASDGAANMVGNNNSVWSRMKAAAPQCKLYKCICHSLALSIQHSCSHLPSNIGFMLAEIPSWFSSSNLRREAFIALFNAMNGATQADDARIAPLPFEKISATRWLVRGKVMYNILVNWYELQAYFKACDSAHKRLTDIRHADGGH